MAFLQRVVNGGGTIDREYAIGTGRMDLCVRFAGAVMAIEIKRRRDKDGDVEAEGIAQLDEYLEGLGLDHGWLFVFDQREGKLPTPQRVSVEERRSAMGRAISVVRG